MQAIEKLADIGVNLNVMDERTVDAVLQLLKRAQNGLTGSVTIHFQEGIAQESEISEKQRFKKK